jgi:hypothetical protein
MANTNGREDIDDAKGRESEARERIRAGKK